jgi:hypothetical protein
LPGLRTISASPGFARITYNFYFSWLRQDCVQS